MTKYTRQMKTEQTGAFIMLNNETHLNDINTIRQGKNWFTEHMGRKTTTTTVLGHDITLPHTGRHVPCRNYTTGEGGAGRQESRQAMKEGGAREETRGSRNRRSLAGPRPLPLWSRRREEPWRRNGRRLQRGDQLWWSRRRRSPRWSGRAEEQEQWGGSGGPRWSRWRRRPRWRWGSRWPRCSQSNIGLRRSWGDEGAGRMKGQGAAGGVESWGTGWSTPDQGRAWGTRESGGASGQMGHGGEEGARSHGGAGGSIGRGGVRASEVGGRVEGNSDHALRWRMVVLRSLHRIDGGLRVSRGAARRQWRRQERVGVVAIFEERALDDTSEERALEDLKPPQGWTRESRMKEGWTEPAGVREREEGAVRSPEQHPSLSDPTPCPAVPDVLTAHPQPWCRGRSSTLYSLPHGGQLLPVHTPWLTSSIAGTSAVGSGMRSTNRVDGGLISYFVSHSWGIPMMKITGLSHLFKWENLHNLWLTKYFFAPLYIYQGFSKFTFKGPNLNYHQRQKVQNICYYKTCFL